MASLSSQLFSVTVALGAVLLVSGYSFNNCIEDQHLKGKSFKCIRRKVKNMSAILNDLPPTATNLTISINPVSHIPNKSFVHLPNLQNLKMDHNNLKTIDQFAFQDLDQLVSLNLSFNYIPALNSSVFKDLHNLTFLSLTNNTLKQLPEGIFTDLLNLDTLKMCQNFLTNFSGIVQSVSHLLNLKILDLESNKISSLSHLNISLPKSLTTLYLSKNNLLTLECQYSFLSFINLLDLSYNPKLPSMAFQGVDLRSVHYLRLRSTSVNVVDFLNISNISAGHVDFSGTGLKNENLLIELCRLLHKRVKSINKLRLSGNGLTNLTSDALNYCPKIIEFLDLSRNNLKSPFCLNILDQQTQLRSVNVEHNHLNALQYCQTQNMSKLTNLEELSYRYNRILSVGPLVFHHTPNIKTLKLNINSISFLDRNTFKGLTSLETLRLDNNLLTDLFSCQFIDNFNLKTLNLRNNRISVIFNRTFLGLTNLTTLDLGGNKITHFDSSGLDGLKSLSKFYLDGNNLIRIDTSLTRVFQDTLTVLDLRSNKIRFLNERISSPFMNLSKLKDLKLDGQRPHGLTVLPRNFFRGLYSLKSLYLTNNNINSLAPDAFDDLRDLIFLTLDNCCVGVTQLQPGIFKNLRNLTKLIVENMGIQNFSKAIFGNLTQLNTLQLNHNVMQSIDVDALESLPKLNYLDMRNIPLSCTCENSLLQNWTVHNERVQVVYLYNMQCPQYENSNFYKFDTRVCYKDLGKYLFLSTAVFIFLFTVIPLLYVKLYWKLKYGYYVFSSWFSEQWRRIREEEENCKYDAFISYNSSDEQWILDQLLPNLEGNGSSFKLCLHHRDFELGRDIVDNIVSAVYSSRKTLCVVSRNFLRSEWCSLEIQLASYRLFDEHRDVLLLVFLEPISERQVSTYHHMRKVMLKKTYLQWPGPDCINPTEAQELFWNQLRRAIQTGSRLKTEQSYNQGGEEKTTENSETHILDENYYLQP